MSSLFLVNVDIITQLRKGEERDLRFEDVETMREKMSDGQTIRLQTGPSVLSWAAFTIIEGRLFW